MITVFTGPINSGKSCRLGECYREQKLGDGFQNIRRFRHETYVGQDIIQLSTGKSVPFSRVCGQIPPDWDEVYTYKNYSFSKSGFAFAEDIVNQVLHAQSAAFIDEWGPLELMEKGFYPSIQRLLEHDIDLYIVVRESCLVDFFESFPQKHITIENKQKR